MSTSNSRGDLHRGGAATDRVAAAKALQRLGVVALLGCLGALASCVEGSQTEQRVEAITCPEAVRIDARGNPVGVVSGHIRRCWPGEANCFCDADNDCYDQAGYVPCTPPVSGADAATDARIDTGTDVRTDTATDVRTDTATDVRVDAGADVRADTGADVRMDTGTSGGTCPEAVRLDAHGNPVGVVSGHIRRCWPGEANCFCDADNDCYDRAGYVPCTPPVSGADAGTDLGTDARADVAADAGTDAPTYDGAAAVGSWSAAERWPYPAVHSMLLPDGRVLFWSDDHATAPYLWNPITNALTDTGFTRTELHCAGQSFLSDGRLFITGGEPVTSTGAGVGVTDTNIFDFRTNTFSDGPTMRDLRWYPTNTTLANGEVLVTGGTRDNPGNDNRIPEVYGLDGTLRALTGASRAIETYPFMFLAPNGMVFQAGPYHDTWYLDPTGVGGWVTLTSMNAPVRYLASSVMYDDGKVLVVGGTQTETSAPFATAEVIDLRAATPRWTYTGAMAAPRRDLAATLLPDGTVLVAGGTRTDGSYVLEPEIWSPATGAFTRMAPATVGRAYHSETLLLPDGRVLFAGGNNYLLHGNMQVFSPPYLFRGPRPTVTSAPTSVAYGAPFAVATPDAARVAGAAWIRLGAFTHGFDQNQRINRLAVTATAGGVTMTAPSDARLCPPGHYQLFLLSDRGVPSIARVIQIR